MKTIRLIAAAVALTAAGVTPAMAQNALQNGTFSSGLANWDSFGDVIVSGGVNPRAVLSTASSFDDDDGLGIGYNNNSGVTAVDLGAVSNLAGVSVLNLDIGGTAYEASAIRQSFAANAGDLITVSFTWAFLSLEAAATDFAFTAVNNSVVKFADVTSVPAASVFNGTFGDFNNVTWNWNNNTVSYTANANGIQSFSLGVVDVGDYTLTSELRVDNVSILVTAVPEPEAYAMLLAGLGLMGAIARRRKA